MSFTVVIPARYASSRLPGKPLLDIGGKPMVQRVYEQAALSSASRVIIATDSEQIEKAANAFGAEVYMTSKQHSSGTDRIQEVVQKAGIEETELLINVQGDEPLIPPSVINQVAENLVGTSEAGIATLCEAIVDLESLLDPAVVKVVSDDNGMALYFSRAPIPWPREQFADKASVLPENGRWFRHLGIYAYRVAFLNQYVGWQPSELEQLEKLEQLRAMSHGIKIHVVEALETVPAGIDTLIDLERVRALLAACES
jgi:3-deoxy-manno-octulosonate cytidylyltransferase (CMP-KDO synthetase)